jgi:Fe-Mn family superoxide dismutase
MFTLDPLPYPAAALEPAIDATTMEIHHGRHHKTYVDNLNNALKDHANLLSLPIDKLLHDIKSVPEAARQAVINNGGGHANHALFWSIMGPTGDRSPTGALAEALASTFGDFDKFKATIKQNALTQFGSGWSWLVWDGSKLVAVKKPNQDSPLMDGHTPILGIDVWEHAYYLKYQNKRADYVDAWWSVVNWTAVGARFDAVRAGK